MQCAHELMNEKMGFEKKKGEDLMRASRNFSIFGLKLVLCY